MTGVVDDSASTRLVPRKGMDRARANHVGGLGAEAVERGAHVVDVALVGVESEYGREADQGEVGEGVAVKR